MIYNGPENIRDFRAVPIELFAFENGTITLLGEMRAYQSNMVTLFNLAGPTLVSMADKTAKRNSGQNNRVSDLAGSAADHPGHQAQPRRRSII